MFCLCCLAVHISGQVCQQDATVDGRYADSVTLDNEHATPDAVTFLRFTKQTSSLNW